MPQATLPLQVLRRIRTMTGRTAALVLALVLIGPVSVASAWNQPPLGVPQQTGYAVANVADVKSQLSNATGMQFGPTTTTTATVVLPEQGDIRRITLKQTRSVRGGPFFELVEASSRIGPWAANSTEASFYMSYAVDSVWLSSQSLALAGMSLVAFSGTDFVYWKSPQGVLVRLIDKDLVPSTGGTATTPAGTMDLGQPIALSFSPCAGPALKELFSSALGLTWRPQVHFPLPYEFSDGTSQTIDGAVDISAVGPPFVTVEVPLHAPAGAPYACTATRTPIHLSFLADDVPAAAAQVQAAGMEWLSRVPGLTSYHRGRGVYLEIAHSSFLGG